MHIAVLGLGPAGSLLAHRAVARGWTVDGYDPACRGSDGTTRLPEWRGTFGFPVDSLPAWARDLIPFASVSPRLTAHTAQPRELPYGPYGIVDGAELRRRLSPGIRLHRRRLGEVSARELGVDAVVDCRGVIDRPGAVRQVAYGVFLPPEVARDAGLTSAVFMDWRSAGDHDPAGHDPAGHVPADHEAADHEAADLGPGDPCPGGNTGVREPSFLYVQDTGSRVLVEETVLATRTPTRDLLPVLQERLRSRIGDVVDAAEATETVHFPMDRRRRPWYLGPDADGVCTFGAAGGLTHPATGYSVAAAVTTADSVLDTLSGTALRRRDRWSAALTWRLRLLGAELIVRARDPQVLPRFFDAFFRLPAGLQRGYLEGQDAGRVAAAMVSLAAFPARVLPFLRPLPEALYYTLKPR